MKAVIAAIPVMWLRNCAATTLSSDKQFVVMMRILFAELSANSLSGRSSLVGS
jgi:hypothetical protein